MRYREILEMASRAPQSNNQQKQKRAREQLAAAEKKRSDAAQEYQDKIDAARAATDKARNKLQASRAAEAVQSTGFAPTLKEAPKATALRDRNGRLIGWLEPVGSILQARDRKGSLVGWYDGRQNQTRDSTGTLVGSGDLLSALLICKARR